MPQVSHAGYAEFQVDSALATLALLVLSLIFAFPAAADEPVKGDGDVASDPYNARLGVQVATNGRFNVGAFPNPLNGAAQAGSFNLLFNWPNGPATSYTTVAVDGSKSFYGAGTAVQAPTDSGDHLSNTSAWAYGPDGAVRVTQTLRIVTNPLTGQPDLAQVSYTVTNNDALNAHTVGLRAMFDTMLNGNDGAPFRVPDIGAVTTERDFTGAAVPDSFQALYNLSDTTHVAAAVLRGIDATPPDRLVLGQWVGLWDCTNVNGPCNASVPAYDYTVTPTHTFTSDSAYALYWNEAPLAAGASRTYTSYYGLGVLQSTGDQLQLGVSSPASLGIAGSDYSPNPFDVVATLENHSPAATTNTQATITLPAGLTLASGTATQSVPSIPLGGSAQVTWRVQAAPQASATTLNFTVAASADNGLAASLQRPVALPALLLNRPPTANAGDSYTVPEGGTVTLNGRGSDPDAGDTLTYAWDLDNNGSFETTGQAPTFSAATLDGPSRATVTLQVCDNHGACATSPATVNVTNVAPTPTIAGAPTTLTYGGSLALIGSATDPSAADTAADFTYAWSVTRDGATYGTGGSGKNFGFTPAGVRSYVVTLTATDKDNGVGTTTATIAVTKATPTTTVAASNATYDGQPHGATAQTTGIGSPAAVLSPTVITYSGRNGTIYASSTVAPTNAGDYTATASYGGDANYTPSAPVSKDFTIGKAPLTVTADNKTKVLGAANPPLTATIAGFVNNETAAVLSGAPALSTTATTTSPVGPYPITVNQGTLAAANYTFAFAPGILSVQYASAGTCGGAAGHAVLQPINADDSSVFKQGSTVPVKFRICDANGVSIGTPGVVTGFLLTQKTTGTVVSTPNETVDSSTPDTTFRWDPTAQQWIFNLNTNTPTLTAGSTYTYRITLNDGSTITFTFGLK